MSNNPQHSCLIELIKSIMCINGQKSPVFMRWIAPSMPAERPAQSWPASHASSRCRTSNLKNALRNHLTPSVINANGTNSLIFVKSQEMACHKFIVGRPGRDIIGKTVAKWPCIAHNILLASPNPVSTRRQHDHWHPHTCCTMEPMGDPFICIWGNVYINEIKCGRFLDFPWKLLLLDIFCASMSGIYIMKSSVFIQFWYGDFHGANYGKTLLFIILTSLMKTEINSK